MTHENVVQLRL